MKKRFSAVLAAALALSMLSGCAEITHPLSDHFDEAEVTAAAHAVLDEIIQEDYQAVVDAFRDDMVQTYSITPQTIQDMVSDALDGAGKYVSTEETLVLAGESKEFKEPFASVTIYCEYKEEDVIYEMSLDTDLELIGFSAKQK